MARGKGHLRCRLPRRTRCRPYLFLPKNVRPPYQTVLFFPSARVEFIPDNQSGRNLRRYSVLRLHRPERPGRYVSDLRGHLRATRLGISLPGGAPRPRAHPPTGTRTQRVRLDYLATRPDIDNNKLAYLGVSMGSAEGVIVSSLMQDRLKTTILLDGGFFLETPPRGGESGRLCSSNKKPGFDGQWTLRLHLSSRKAQNPLFAMLGTHQRKTSATSSWKHRIADVSRAASAIDEGCP